MSFSPLLDELVHALRCLPGVGPKSAQRMAFHLLQRRRDAARTLANCLHQAMDNIAHCKDCRTFSEEEICRLCANPKRNNGQLCIVGSPADILAFEQSGGFSGRYFVLHGLLSPIDGIGPNDIGVQQLLNLLESNRITEVILATNPTVEGAATAHYIADAIRPFAIRTTRIAHGVPVGGDIEYIDSSTLFRALAAREIVESF